MPAYEVSRTLVKSPPEVWSELERVERLAELLGDGTIEIVATKPESEIRWRGERASGTIEIAASGWGTRVKLTAEAAEATGVAAEATGVEVEAPAKAPAPGGPVDGGPADGAGPQVKAGPATSVESIVEREPVATATVEPVVENDSASVAEGGETGPQSEPVADTEPEREVVAEPSSTAEPERLGFWKRLFSRSRDAVAAEEAVPEAVSVQMEEVSPEPVVEAEPEPEQTAQAEPMVETAAESESDPTVKSEPESAVEPEPVVVSEPDQTGAPVDYEALLTSVLDHLGSAHKRPFTHA
ncbi:MAG: hypothetical protein HZB14_07365 [Actinobacteria bacterium]|nr:hypothetical protein [Actinomycetota bacterium]